MSRFVDPRRRRSRSGSAASRPHLDACLDHLREDDVLTVWKLDRLGRNTQHVLAVVDELTSRGIGFRSLTEGLHTDGPMGTAMLTIMAAFAQLERDTMIERTRAGLAAAAANGRKGGRPRKVDDADAAKARKLRRRASRPPTSQRCWESPAQPFTVTSLSASRSQPETGVPITPDATRTAPCGMRRALVAVVRSIPVVPEANQAAD